MTRYWRRSIAASPQLLKGRSKLYITATALTAVSICGGGMGTLKLRGLKHNMLGV